MLIIYSLEIESNGSDPKFPGPSTGSAFGSTAAAATCLGHVPLLLPAAVPVLQLWQVNRADVNSASDNQGSTEMERNVLK